MLPRDMLVSLTWFFLLNSFSVILSGAIPIPTSPLPYSVLYSTVDAINAPPNHDITPRHAHNLANASHDHQTGPVAPFPKYAVALLALFIVICGLSSAVLVVLFYSKTSPARQRLGNIARRLWGPRPRPPQAPDRRKDKRHRDKVYTKQEEKILDITQNASDSSVPAENGNASKSESTDTASVEKTDTSLTLSTGTAEKAAAAPADSSQQSDSSSPEALHILVSASTTALERLSRIISPPDDAIDVIPSAEASSVQPEHLSNTETTSSLTNNVSLNSPDDDDDNSDHTGNSHDSTSSTAFYSLADALSPSTAVYSLVDLAAFQVLNPTTPGSLEAPEEHDITDAYSSPRYVPGVQLETIQEESESFSTISQSTLTRPGSIIHSSSRNSFLESILERNTPTHGNQSLNQRLTRTQSLSASISLTDRIPSTWEELAIDPQNPLLPRFYPAARPAPLPSEPTSAVPRVPARRSPDKSDRHHSVAWLSPVVEWAVDDPRESLHENDSITLEEEDECEDALQAADAMAAVMDSLAAAGMDPTKMGLMTEDATSDPFPDSPPPTDMLMSNENMQSHPTADFVEEDEVEKEIGTGSGPTSPNPGSVVEDRNGGGDVNTPRPFQLSSPDASSSKAGERVARTRNSRSLGGANEGENFARESDRRRSTGSPLEQRPRTAGKRSQSSNAIASVGSPSNTQTFRTPRAVKPDRVYPSPSSLAGLSPAEVTKRFSLESTSSTGSTPPPRETRPLSPQHHFSPVSPLQIRKGLGASLSPTLHSTPSTLTSSPRSDSGSPTPRSQSPLFYKQHVTASPSTPRASDSPRRSTSSTRPLSPRKNLHQSISSPVSLSAQRMKSMGMSQLTRSPSILKEKSNSMEFVKVL